MTQALATTAGEGPVNAELLTSYLTAMGLATMLNANEKTQFLNIAQAYGLNPFKREIYVAKYGQSADTFSIIVGFETYLKRAERSGKLDGWEAEFRGEGDSLSCVVTIYRKDWSRPFKHEAFYEECVQRTNQGHVTKFWKKAKLMTRKVAISQEFRMAFPDELGGLPYTGDELGADIQDVGHEVVQEANPLPALTQPVPKPLTKQQSADLMKALDIWNKNVGSLVADPERVHNPEAYQIAATALKAIENLPNKEKVKTFDGLVNLAFENGIDWDGETKTFFAVPDAVEAEEVDALEQEMQDVSS